MINQSSIDITSVRMSNTRPVVPSAPIPGVPAEPPAQFEK